MGKSIQLFIAVLLTCCARAQSDHFIMIRADNDQPFYVRMGDKILSSSSGGHLIISRLKDSVYSFTIGWPRRAFPDEDFSVPVIRDLGFQLKYLDEKGWVLFNTQTMEIVKPKSKPKTDTGSVVAGVKKDDAFSRMMAGVVNDTAVMYNTYAADTATRSKGVDQDLAAAVTRDSVKKVVDTVMTPSPYVELLAQHRTAVSFDLRFADHDKGRIDTVDVSIPKDTVYHKPPPPIVLAPDTTAKIKLDTATMRQTDTAGKRQTDTVGKSRSDTSKAVQQPSQAKPKDDHPKLVVANSDCHNFATDADVVKVKAKLQAIPKDEDRIINAKKTFRLKCFTTSQIRTLCEVFSGDASKFSFLEAAYPFVSDDQFRTLTDLLSDPFYVGKFKKMTGQ